MLQEVVANIHNEILCSDKKGQNNQIWGEVIGTKGFNAESLKSVKRKEIDIKLSH